MQTVPPQSSDDLVPKCEQQLAELLADREQVDANWRPRFIARSRRFLEEQRLERITPYIAFGGTTLMIGPLMVVMTVLAEPSPGLSRRMLASLVVCVVGTVATFVIAMEARAMERAHSGRRFGEAWRDYQLRVREHLRREMPGCLSDSPPGERIKPWEVGDSR